MQFTMEASVGAPSGGVSPVEFLDLCDDALNLILAVSRPFEALCLGVTCRRLHLLARALRPIIRKKFRATGGHGLCWCMLSQVRRRERVVERYYYSGYEWFWGHICCAITTSVHRRRCTHPFEQWAELAANLGNMAAGGHINLFRSAFENESRHLNSRHLQHILEAAFGAGEGEILTLLSQTYAVTSSHEHIDLNYAFQQCIRNGHIAVLAQKYHAEGWDGYNHNPQTLARAAMGSGGQEADIWALIPSLGNITTLVPALEHRRIDLMKTLAVHHPACLGMLAHVKCIDHVRAGREMLLLALELGMTFDPVVLWRVIKSKWYDVAVAIAAAVPAVPLYWHDRQSHTWPGGTMKSAVLRGTPADIARLAAAGCPCSRNAYRRAFARGDPAILQALTAAFGDSMPPRLFKRLAA